MTFTWVRPFIRYTNILGEFINNVKVVSEERTGPLFYYRADGGLHI